MVSSASGLIRAQRHTEYIPCQSRSVSCDSCESLALCPLAAGLWTVATFLPVRDGGVTGRV